MRNSEVISVYALLIFVSLSIIILTFLKRERSKLDTNLVFLAFVFIGWEIFEICFYAASNKLLVQLYFDIKLPFVAMASIACLVFVLQFYGLEKTITKPVAAAFLVVFLFTSLLAVTTLHHSLLRSEFSVFEMTPVREYAQVRGPWFWVHSIYCYLLIIACFTISVTQYHKTPSAYRLPSMLLIFGMGIAIATNLLVITTPTPIDISLLGASVTLVLLYHANKSYQGLDFVFEARRKAFDHLRESVFVLDSAESIIAMNQSSRLWLKDRGVKTEEQHFKAIIDRLRDMSEKQTHPDEEEGSVDYYLEDGTVCNVRKRAVLDTKGKTLGYFAFITDETSNRELIEYLDRRSGLDALTGLLNRRKIEKDLIFLDCEENYPLAILYGDINYLKETNDTYGHYQGDTLLRLIAEALKTACPPSAHLGRVGGDEFIVLIPKCDESAINAICQSIRDYLEKENVRYPFTVSVALGYAIKKEETQDTNELKNEADMNMYADKSSIKAQQKCMTSK